MRLFLLNRSDPTKIKSLAIPEKQLEYSRLRYLVRVSILFLSLVQLLYTSTLFAEDKVKVGVSLALSGPLAEYGYAIKNGISLAQSEKKEGLEKLQFIYEDDQYNPKVGVSNFHKLISVDKVNLMFIWGTEPALTIAPLAEREKMPLFSLTPLVSISKGRKYVVRFIYNSDKHGKALTQYFAEQGIEKIGMIMSDSNFFQLLSDGISDHLKSAQSLSVIDSVLPNETDFRSILLKSNLKDFDIIGVYLFPPQLKAFYKQANQLGIKLRTFGSTTFESTSILQDIMPLLEGIPYSHTSTSEKFLEDYTAAFKNDMHVGYAATAYDFATILGRLVSTETIQSKSAPDEIIAAFKSVKPFNGAAGKIRLVDSPQDGTAFDYGLSIKKFIGGKVTTEFTLE